MTVNRIDRKNFMPEPGGPWPGVVSSKDFSRTAGDKLHKFPFGKLLLAWNKRSNRRKMPWKGEKDPYKIWLSEIILQQTRVEQGLKYYQKFLRAYPNVQKLAAAAPDKVYKLWEGLGYYSRCQNLLQTAKYIARELNGNFPADYVEIKRLKGVGPYTAAAIASFAFDQPHAVVDGNVYRVLSRLYAINTPIDSTKGKHFFSSLAAELLDKNQPGLYNQAIMDFGATICKPLPLCTQCPFRRYCLAFRQNEIFAFPVKGKRAAIRKRWFNYVILEKNGSVAIRKREGKDIWKNLFEFLLIESPDALSEPELIQELRNKKLAGKNGHKLKHLSQSFKQQLTHQLIEGRFIMIQLNTIPELDDGFFWVKKQQLKNYAFPRFFKEYLQKIAATTAEAGAKKIHISV
jgi:A/G-specific adenine glycosylase